MASGILEVLLVGAEGIKERKKFGCLNCFAPCQNVSKNTCVLIKYGDQNHISSAAKERGRKQVWNESIKFKVEYPIEEIQKQNHKLVFHILDSHHVSTAQFVGESTIYVKDVVLHGMDKGQVELKHRKYRVVRPDNTYSGEIFVAVTFTKLNYENHKGKDGMEKEAWKIGSKGSLNNETLI